MLEIIFYLYVGLLFAEVSRMGPPPHQAWVYIFILLTWPVSMPVIMSFFRTRGK